MRLVQRMAVVGVLVGVLAACSTEGDETAPPVEAASSADGDEATTDHSEGNDDASASSESTGNSVPRVIESDLRAESLDALVRLAEGAGLDCGNASGDGEATTHSARLCDGNVLFTYFADVDAMDSYVTGYHEKGNHVVRGDNWFVTGRPAAIDPLIATLQGE